MQTHTFRAVLLFALLFVLVGADYIASSGQFSRVTPLMAFPSLMASAMLATRTKEPKPRAIYASIAVLSCIAFFVLKIDHA